MNKKYYITGKKGISPLIASVLLIAFTVALGTLVMGWLSSTAGSTTETIGTKTETAVGCSDAGVQIEHVYIDGTTGKILVMNTGFKNLTIDGSIYSNAGAECAMTAASSAVGALTELSVACTTTTNTFDRAVVTTDCGGIGDSLTNSSSLVN